MGSTQLIPAAEVSALVEMGFVVILPEYQLCPQVSLHDGPVTDARDCYAWARTTLPGLLRQDALINVDPLRIVVMGHSAGANLALLLGSLPEPPVAILDLYGVKYLRDPHYHTPLPLFASLPEVPSETLAKVLNGPQALTSAPMMLPDGKPNLADPRAAWLLMALKRGTSISGVIEDGNYDRVDGAATFAGLAGKAQAKRFPPTCFIHGTADDFVPLRVAEQAHRELQAAGVPTKLVVGEGLPHAFDLRGLKKEDKAWEIVEKGLEFLKSYV